MKPMQQKFLVSALQLALWSIAPMAWATPQDAATAADADKAAATEETSDESKTKVDEEKTMDQVVVTGSRIRRAGFDTLEPAITVSQEYIGKRGITNVADALNELPGFGVGVTPEGGQSSFGVSQNFVNRFGLGTQRTLTLINGRRVVSSNAPSIFGPANAGLQVDLNIIPTQMVDRVENLAIGGAPTYGSDAIAGVVNVITKTDYEGLNVGATYGITERGDGQRYNGNALYGMNFADGRGNFTVSGSFDTVDGVVSTERERFANGFSFQPNPLASDIAANQAGRLPGSDGRVNPNIPFNTGNTDGIPNAVLIRNNRFFTFTAGGLLLQPTGAVNLASGLLRGFGANNRTYLQFDSSGNIVPFNPGVNFGNNNASGGDGFNLATTAPLTNDLDRATFNTNAHFDLTDNIRVYAEGTYYKAKAQEIVDQSIYNVNLFGGLSAPITIAAC
jgi:outer membrane receptor protein involved in Fe transport